MHTVSHVMNHVRNHFPLIRADGAWRATPAGLEGPMALPSGAWIAVTRSAGRDGVYHADESGAFEGLKLGSFEGRVWVLNPPADFLALCEEIAQWQADHPRGVSDWSAAGVSRRTSGHGWEKEFAAQLRPWRRMFNDIS